MKKTIITFIKKRRLLSALILVILLIIIGGIYKATHTKVSYESVKVVKGSVVEEVSVTGKVSPADDVELAFEQGGTIGSLGVKVGDKVTKGTLLGSLQNGELAARYSSELTNVAIEQEKLSILQRGLRPEELAVEEAKYNSSKISAADARKDLLNALFDTYSKLDQAVRNKTDQFFNYPESPNPTVKLNTTESATKKINAQRIITEKALVALNDDAVAPHVTESEINHYISLADTAFVQSSELLSELSSIIFELPAHDQQDSYKVDITTAQTILATAKTNLSTSVGKYQSAVSALQLSEREYTLQKSGSSTEDIRSQELRVRQAQAELQNIAAQLGKSMLRSPIDGIVTKVEPKVGEIFAAGKLAFAVISDGQLQVEVNVPEADISKIHIGNKADITLDAYGPGVVFEASVIMIDPAETVIEGVPTYKVTLQFAAKDDRVRSGMTANIDMTTNIHENTLYIPFRAITDKGGKKTVRVVAPDATIKEVEVETGLRGSNGDIEILKGLSEGDAVVTYSK